MIGDFLFTALNQFSGSYHSGPLPAAAAAGDPYYDADPTSYAGTKMNLRVQPVPTGSNCAQFQRGLMRFNRRFDDSLIESQAVGAVPFNFIPEPYPATPEP